MMAPATRPSTPARITGLEWFTSFVRRFAVPLAVCTVLGAAAGFVVASTDQQYKATVVLGVRPGADAGQTSTLVESAASTVTSDVVINATAKELGVDPGVLAKRVTATVQSGTTLIDVSATGPSPDDAVRAATTLADQALTDYRDRSAAIGNEVRTAGEESLKNGKLSAPTAEDARQKSIGDTVGTAQGQSIQGAVTLSVVSPASSGVRAGVTKPVGILLGAAAGFLLCLLVLLAGGWRGRRRIRNAADLADVRGASALLRTNDVNTLAGLVLESGRRCVVLLGVGAGDGDAGRSALAMGLEEALQRGGQNVARVLVGANPEPTAGLARLDSGEWAVGSRRASSVLARSARDQLADRLGVDTVVIGASSSEPATRLLYGQSDFASVVEVVPGTRLANVEAVVEPLGASDPVVFLSSR